MRLDPNMNEPSFERYRQEKKRFEGIISSIKLKEVPVFHKNEKKWLASEEIALLQSIENYSYGNWGRIATALSSQFKKKFTPEEVRDHYISTYWEGDIAEAMKVSQSKMYQCHLTDHTTEEDDELLRRSDVYTYENVPTKFLKELRYMPLREDYKEECLDEAEELICFIDFASREQFDKNLNLLRLDVYREKLVDRIAMKEFIKEQKLVEGFFLKKFLETISDEKAPPENAPPEIVVQKTKVPSEIVPEKKPSQKDPTKKRPEHKATVTVQPRILRSSSDQLSGTEQVPPTCASNSSITNGRKPVVKLKRKRSFNNRPKRKRV